MKLPILPLTLIKHVTSSHGRLLLLVLVPNVDY